MPNLVQGTLDFDVPFENSSASSPKKIKERKERKKEKKRTESLDQKPKTKFEFRKKNPAGWQAISCYSTCSLNIKYQQLS